MSAGAALRCGADAIDAAAMRSAEAVGIGVDDIDDPHCVVIVHGGEVVCELVSPGLETLPSEQVADVRRACRFMARASWAAQKRYGVST